MASVWIKYGKGEGMLKEMCIFTAGNNYKKGAVISVIGVCLFFV